MVNAGMQPRSGRVIPNGGEETQFRVLPDAETDGFRRNLGLGEGRILLTVGNVSERKGQDIVIRALPRVLKSFPQTHYLIVGLPTKRRELEALALELGVRKHVHLFGKVSNDELVRYLNSCDVFLLTSRHAHDGDCEGYGIAVVEAALCGKPAIVSSGSGLAEAIVHDQTGFAVPEGDVRATAEAILVMLSDDELRERMGQAAFQRASHEQTWSSRVKEYDELLRSFC